MLLKDPSEPIQDNIGERMAYILGKTVQERLEIESLVKQVYAMRSKFVHHGQRPTDMDILARFMEKVGYFSSIGSLTIRLSKRRPN